MRCSICPYKDGIKIDGLSVATMQVHQIFVLFLFRQKAIFQFYYHLEFWTHFRTNSVRIRKFRTQGLKKEKKTGFHYVKERPTVALTLPTAHFWGAERFILLYPRPPEENFERNLDKIHEHGRNLKTDANRRKSSKEAVIHAQKKLLTAM